MIGHWRCFAAIKRTFGCASVSLLLADRNLANLSRLQLSASSLQLDRKIRYLVSPKTAIAIKRLREQFSAAMSARLRGKAFTEGQERWFELGVRCLRTGLWDGDEPVVGVL